MIKDDFEPFELDNLIRIVRFFTMLNSRHYEAEHLLLVLEDVRERGEVLTIKTEDAIELEVGQIGPR